MGQVQVAILPFFHRELDKGVTCLTSVRRSRVKTERSASSRTSSRVTDVSALRDGRDRHARRDSPDAQVRVCLYCSKSDIASRWVHRESNLIFTLDSDEDHIERSFLCSSSISVNEF